jgi:hypothetical protein
MQISNQSKRREAQGKKRRRRERTMKVSQNKNKIVMQKHFKRCTRLLKVIF